MSKLNQCAYCGKFISYDDMLNEKVVHAEFTPDTDFTREEIIYYHIKCHNKWVKNYKGELGKPQLIGDENGK